MSDARRAENFRLARGWAPARLRHDAGVATLAGGLQTPFARYWLSGFLADPGTPGPVVGRRAAADSSPDYRLGFRMGYIWVEV